MVWSGVGRVLVIRVGKDFFRVGKVCMCVGLVWFRIGVVLVRVFRVFKVVRVWFTMFLRENQLTNIPQLDFLTNSLVQIHSHYKLEDLSQENNLFNINNNNNNNINNNNNKLCVCVSVCYLTD